MMEKFNCEKHNPFHLCERSSSPTNSTDASSDDEKCFSTGDFDMENLPAMNRKLSRQESSWKRKVKTELCKFWLNGLECEN